MYSCHCYLYDYDLYCEGENSLSEDFSLKKGDLIPLDSIYLTEVQNLYASLFSYYPEFILMLPGKVKYIHSMRFLLCCAVRQAELLYKGQVTTVYNFSAVSERRIAQSTLQNSFT